MLLIHFILALMSGLFFGLVFPLGLRLIGIPMDGADRLLSGLLFGAVTIVVILLIFHRQRRRFLQAAERLPSRPTHQFQLTLSENGKNQAAAVFLCEDCLCLVYMGKHDMPMFLYAAEDIIRTVFITSRRMELHLTQGRVLVFSPGAVEALHKALQERGWLTFQH